MEHYVCFKDNERYEDKEGTAYNLHVTHRKYLQNSGQNFSREGLFKKLRYGSEDKIKIDLKREIWSVWTGFIELMIWTSNNETLSPQMVENL